MLVAWRRCFATVSLTCLARAPQELPEAPEELVVELARRYVLLYETITGQRFEPAAGGAERAERMAASTRAALETL